MSYFGADDRLAGLDMRWKTSENVFDDIVKVCETLLRIRKKRLTLRGVIIWNHEAKLMKTIIFFQNVLIGTSLFLFAFLPFPWSFIDDGYVVRGWLYQISFGAVFLVMIIRPLADIFSGQLWLRRLVILRKGFGIFSASIIVGFMIKSIVAPDSVYLSSFLTADFWSLTKYTFFAHIGDITGLILLITSNAFSQRLLKRNWKRVQRLSYVYFYAGGMYEAFALESAFALYAVMVVTNLTVLAWAIKAWNRIGKPAIVSGNESVVMN